MSSDMRTTMAKTRALITDTERERLAGMADVEDIKVYQAKSRVRRRIQEELTFDVEILAENHPDLLKELREVVCEEAGQPTDTAHQEAGEPEKPTHTAQTPDMESGGEADGGVRMDEGHGRRDDPPKMDANVSDEVRAAVEKVSESWEDTPDRLETRRKAAAVVLQHALDSGEPVGKSSDVVEDVRAAFPVQGQNAETYWRKNIRPVLSEVGEYSKGEHGYVVGEVGDSEIYDPTDEF